MDKKTKGAPAPGHVQRAAKSAIAREGDRVVAERVGISRMALARLAAGLNVHRATAAIAEVKLGGGGDDVDE
jgi:hypothetical protein